jgi:hypothetical protein
MLGHHESRGQGCPSNLDRGDVLGLHALLALCRLVGDLGALLERLEPGTLFRLISACSCTAAMERGIR